jgi:glycosyltransferase involved in cell wall biosynthesis
MSRKVKVGSDVSIVSGLNYATGVQRVLVETHIHLHEIFNNSRIEIRGINLSDGNRFKTSDYLSKDPILNPPYFDFDELDLVLSFDGNNGYVAKELMKGRRRPVIISLAHDILPITHPQYFDELHLYFKVYFLRMLQISDYIICTSEATLKSISALGWKSEAKYLVMPLGTFEIAPTQLQVKSAILSLLAINTIEPRKGYEEILDAFDELVLKGFNVELNIVGRYGWNSLEVKSRIEMHPLLGEKLFWHQGISDKKVSDLYRKSEIVIVASRAEGFGFTLEEGLARGRKVIARNIAVFKERTNPNLYFFEGGGSELASKIQEVSCIPWKPEGMSQIRTMKDFAEDVADLIHEIVEGLPEAT